MIYNSSSSEETVGVVSCVSSHVTAVDSFCPTLVAQLVVFIPAAALQSQWIRQQDCRPPLILRLCLLRLVNQSTHPNQRRPPQSTISLPRPARPQSAVTSVGLPARQSARLRASLRVLQPSRTFRRCINPRREFFLLIWVTLCRGLHTSQVGHQPTRLGTRMCPQPSKSYSSWPKRTPTTSVTCRSKPV